MAITHDLEAAEIESSKTSVEEQRHRGSRTRSKATERDRLQQNEIEGSFSDCSEERDKTMSKIECNFVEERILGEQWKLFLWALVGIVSLLFAKLHDILDRLVFVRPPPLPTDDELLEDVDVADGKIDGALGHGVAVLQTTSMARRRAVRSEAGRGREIGGARPTERAPRREIPPPYNCQLGRSSKPKYYAVVVGRFPGIYKTWAKAEIQVDGYSGMWHKSFKILSEAEQWLERERHPRGICMPIHNHKQRTEFLGVDTIGHDVYKCLCCDEIYCTN